MIAVMLPSSAVKLTILPKITAQPKALSAYVGDTVKFTVAATGAGLRECRLYARVEHQLRACAGRRVEAPGELSGLESALLRGDEEGQHCPRIGVGHHDVRFPHRHASATGGAQGLKRLEQL